MAETVDLIVLGTGTSIPSAVRLPLGFILETDLLEDADEELLEDEEDDEDEDESESESESTGWPLMLPDVVFGTVWVSE